MAPIKSIKSSCIPATTFHLFPWLPIELRFEIWRLCLPHCVCEKDHAVDRILFDIWDQDTPIPCFLYQTSEVNGRPPVITRVCHESRAVALKTRGYYEFLLCKTAGPLPILGPPDIRPWWYAGNCIHEAWFDRTRDVMHLNWEPTYQVDFSCMSSPFQSLAWDTSQASRGGSFIVNFFQNITFRKAELIDFIKQMPSWMVVMRVIIIHADLATAASTGLFGLLGDAPVQLVDVSDEARVSALWKLAEECEPRELVTVCQGFHRESAKAYHQILRDIVNHKLCFEDDFNANTEDVLSRLRPVIMFRLCTEMCNRIGSAATLQGLDRSRRGRGLGQTQRIAKERL